MSRSRSLTCRILAGAVAVFALSAAAPAVAPVATAEAAAPVRYVALGDSAASAPGVPTRVDALCVRSDHNYPSLVAARLRADSFSDMTCAGATTTNVAGRQFAALRSDTTLVTLTTGANDIGFAGVVGRCSFLGMFDGSGAPCRAYYGAQLDQRALLAAPGIEAALRTIHQRSPQARILLVGYLNLIPDNHRGCRPRELFGAGDLSYLDAFENTMNAMLARAARAGHAVFVDNHPASAAHDICRATGTRWTEAIVPTSPAAPFHPNAAGEAAMAGQVLKRA